MRLTILFSVFFSSTSLFADSDKADFCPTVEQITMVMRGEPNLYVYTAENSDGKVFQSDIYGGNELNGPAPAIMFLAVAYNAETKELSCIYYAYSTYGFPVLVNKGDY